MGSTDDRSIAVQPSLDLRRRQVVRSLRMPLQPALRERHVFLDAGVELDPAVLEQRRSHSLCLVIALDEVTLIAEDLQEPINDGSREPLRHLAQPFSRVGSLGLDLAVQLEQILVPLVRTSARRELGRALRSNLTPARSISGLGVGSDASAGGVLLGE